MRQLLPRLQFSPFLDNFLVSDPPDSKRLSTHTFLALQWWFWNLRDWSPRGPPSHHQWALLRRLIPTTPHWFPERATTGNSLEKMRVLCSFQWFRCCTSGFRARCFLVASFAKIKRLSGPHCRAHRKLQRNESREAGLELQPSNPDSALKYCNFREFFLTGSYFSNRIAVYYFLFSIFY